MPVPLPTTNELVSVLKRTSLPTLLVEGTGDAQVYRHIEESLQGLGVNALHCGGRTTLLELFIRQPEFSHIKTVFLADRDMWLFGGIPHQYSEVVWTNGYSIENDIYSGSDIEKIMTTEEDAQFRQLLSIVCKWFAFCVDEHMSGGDANVSVHPNEISPPGTVGLDSLLISKYRFKEPDPRTYDSIIKNYTSHLRGKTLFQVLLRFLAASNRESKYSKSNIMELCVKIRPSSSTKDLLDRLSAKLNHQIITGSS
ncbi:DUF4435 domain-containing protein [Melittangium boletus]|uniref:Uncharacterized protein n=1 Tax=Melittangium boletus DSM 14713 TaxID=1294270 RepID=A0A250IT32_9BACT|nr:DUF4435 domain-containing protein [Melittangium boletus]ATB34096.1 hypothetical protein MEBOL_007597 [Melittangium boletus DSM 14713]